MEDTGLKLFRLFLELDGLTTNFPEHGRVCRSLGRSRLHQICTVGEEGRLLQAQSRSQTTCQQESVRFGLNR
jgi:hypothetical protein